MSTSDGPVEEEVVEAEAIGADAEEEGIGEVETDNSSFLEVLRYLLQGSGSNFRVRLVGNREPGNDDSDSDDDSGHEYFDPRRRYRERTPRPPDRPDTSVIDQSEFKQQMLYEAGLHNPLTKRHGYGTTSTPGFLGMKEIGQFTKLQNVSHGQKTSFSSAYLPTEFKPKRLLKVRDKFFCGMYNEEGDLFISGCQDAKIRIHDTTNGQWSKIKTIEARDVGWSILDIDCSHAGNHVVYSSWSEYVHIFNIRGEHETHEALYLNPEGEHRTAVFSLRFNADDSEIICGTNGGFIYIYDRERKQRTMKIEAHEDDLSGVCFADSSGHLMYSGGEDAVVKVWDRRTLREESPVPVGQLAGHRDSITHIDSKNDARYLITNSKDQSIKLWDIRKFATSEGINATKVAVSKQDWDYRWHPYTGKIVKKKLSGDCSLMTYYGHSVVRTLIRSKFSPVFNTGQKYIYCGDGLGRVVIYDILTGKIARVLENPDSKVGHHKEVIRDVSWHPYENNLISSGWDGILCRWECNRDTLDTFFCGDHEKRFEDEEL